MITAFGKFKAKAIKIEKSNEKPFSNPVFNPETSTADKFFNQISYQIDLTKLYNVKGTCADNGDSYSPVLLEMTNPDIIKAWNGNTYLLQVWDTYGNKLYERSLKQPTRCWAVQNAHFMYLPHKDDADSEYLHIVKFEEEKQGKTILFSESLLAQDVQYIVYRDEILYSANKQVINYVKIPSSNFDEEDKKIVDVSLLKFRTVDTQLTILGMLGKEDILVMFETTDNQVDFNEMKVEKIEDDAEHKYSFVQKTELLPRPAAIQKHDDKIQKFVYIYGNYYVIALRKSGKFDIYWRGRRVSSPDDKFAIDVAMDSDKMYFKLVDNTIWSVEHKWATYVSFNDAQEITGDKSQEIFDEVKVSMAKPSLNLYKDFKTVKVDAFTSYMIIAHGNFLSVYSIAKEKWVKHTQYEEDQIRMLFLIKNNEDNVVTGVVLRNGSVYIDDLKYTDKTQLTIAASEVNCQIKDKIIRIYEDIRYQQFLFIVVEVEQKKQLKWIYKGELLDVEGLDVEITGDANILKLTQLTDDHYFIQQEDHVYKYSIEYVDTQVPKKKEVAKEEAKEQAKEEEQKTVEPATEEVADEVADEVAEEVKQEAAEVVAVVEEETETKSVPKLSLKKKIKLDESISQKLHSIIFTSSGQEDDNMMLVGADCMYLHYNVENNKFKTVDLKESGVTGVLRFTNKIIYGLTKQGLKLYDMDAIIKGQAKKEAVQSTLLKEIEVGFKGSLLYSESNKRISVLESYKRILIFPELHLNTIRFMGIIDEDQYLAFKVVGDKYIALGLDNVLYCWSMISGKMINQHKLVGKDYSEYTLVDSSLHKRMQNRSLIKSKEPIVDESVDQYFEAFQLQKIHKEQSTYIQNMTKSIKRWILLEIVDEWDVREIVNMLHPEVETYHILYFNKECDKLIVWYYYNNNIYFYSLDQIQGKPVGHVKTKYIKKFETWPENFNDGYGYPQILSPDFSQMVDPQKQTGQIIIRDTITDKELYKIPLSLMNLNHEVEQNHCIHRFKWVSSDTFIVANKEGIEKIIYYGDGSFKELGTNVIPLYEKENYKDWRHYVEKAQFELENTYEWLERKYRLYKSAYQLHNERDPIKLYQLLINVDSDYYNTTNLSFTYLHWKIIEQIEKGEVEVDKIDDDILKTLVFNILPGGNTLIHRVCSKSLDGAIHQLFKKSQPNKDNLKEVKMYVPIIPNFLGKTGLHICKDKENFKTIDVILQYIQHYHIDHCSTAIKDLIPELIKHDIPSLLDYLDNKLIQNDQSLKITRGLMKPEYKGVTESSLWFNKTKMRREMFQQTQVEPNIKCEFLDMPGVYHFEDSTFDNFYGALADSENYDLFGKKAIQRLIDFNFKVVRKYTIRRLFMPFAAFLILFVTYLNVVYEMRFSEDKDVRLFWAPIDLGFMGLLGVFSVYFLANEVKQLTNDGLAYLTSIWNFIDIIPPIGIFLMLIANIISSFVDIDNTIERSIQAIATFFMWFKLLYFLRIFKNTGYLIRMVIVVTYDMRFFLLVLLITIAAFGDSMLSMSLGNPIGDQRFIGSFTEALTFTYRMVLGDWESSEFGEVGVPLVWILFLLCTLFNMIVMLNLLIAIISETFAKVNENAISAGYQEMAAMISENSYLVPDSVKQTYAEKDKYLMIVTDLEAEAERLYSDPVLEKIADMYTDFKAFAIKQDEYDRKMNEEQEKLTKEQEKTKKDLEESITEKLKQVTENQGKLEKYIEAIITHHKIEGVIIIAPPEEVDVVEEAKAEEENAEEEKTEEEKAAEDKVEQAGAPEVDE